MATRFKVEFEGFLETKELFQIIHNDIGPKDATKVLRNAVRKSMKPALVKARQLVAKDTGALAASLQVESRFPGRKDKGSKYVYPGDVVIGKVTTASGKKLAAGVKVYDPVASYEKKKDVYKTITVKSDARATALEFGTSKKGARPFLRPALESTSEQITGSLVQSLRTKFREYKAREAKKGK